MVIVDTTVWIEYLRGTDTPETTWLDRELVRQPIALTDLILSEILQGIHDERSFATTREQLLKLYIFDTGGTDLAIASALNYRKLRKLGYTVRKTIDCLIATFCIETGHELLHRDRDFYMFEKELALRVIHP